MVCCWLYRIIEYLAFRPDREEPCVIYGRTRHVHRIGHASTNLPSLHRRYEHTMRGLLYGCGFPASRFALYRHLCALYASVLDVCLPVRNGVALPRCLVPYYY